MAELFESCITFSNWFNQGNSQLYLIVNFKFHVFLPELSSNNFNSSFYRLHILCVWHRPPPYVYIQLLSKSYIFFKICIVLIDNMLYLFYFSCPIAILGSISLCSADVLLNNKDNKQTSSCRRNYVSQNKLTNRYCGRATAVSDGNIC